MVEHEYIIAKITAPRKQAIKNPTAEQKDPVSGRAYYEDIAPAVSFQIMSPEQFKALKESRAKHGVTVTEAK